MTDDVTKLDEPDCGCAPTPAEQRSFWSNVPVTRRGAIGLGLLGAAALTTFGVASGVTAAHAASYPTWDDVLAARASESAKAAEISRIQGLIQSLADRVAQAQAAAAAAADEFFKAQQAFNESVRRADSLQAQADEKSALADESAKKAGQVAAQLYRNGGDDTSLELFFAGSAQNADQLLAKLGQMDKLLEHNQSVYESAVAARNSAQQLSDQATVARDERDRLQQLAEAKFIEAQNAAAAAEAALAEQEANRITLEAQLAALQSETAQTVADYEAGVAERKRIEEERRRAEEERLRREAEEAAKNQPSPPPSGGGGGGGGSGWVRPHGGWVTSEYGPREVWCGNGYCSSGYHEGTDFANGCGAYIYAAAAGTVDAAWWYSGFGNWIRIQHGNGIATSYAHIRDGGYNVRVGQWVEAGQVIAYAGTTGNSFGCHLHFEVYEWGRTVNPRYFLQNRGVWI